ncbi:1,4-dihydroxy-2-naphthoate octaprenyltransferase [Saccharothrix ecbatanensis]|uniref:1,4-dihydroxy-2-naphthoate octaprenyltransferase n=1 Tax=Saccharothrix ecbatanensis TaxID=1105145 RepID=A0A7W9HHF1_9PSEU|nr:UbiA family prenyltransferase [Saccharothrix ecbatanensis]MBB5802353.1 1,4-dihydroxy-2-naphthoate octaprenyltransferase [Saccharothrix ecbatanensis]
MTTTVAPGSTGAYVKLAKLDIVDYYLGVLVVWALLAPALRLDGGVLATMGVFLVGEVFVIVAMVALDDLTGYRDGSDIANYAPDAPARKLNRKPLVAGTLTEPQVLRFGLITAVVGAAVWLGALAIAPHRPMWTLVLVAVTYFFALQYSWGVKLSYHGFQEFFLAALGWALVIAPYGLVTGGVDGVVVVQALIFGLGPLLFGVYSNTNDVAGDRRVGRPTVAALTSPRGNMLFVAGVSACELLLILALPLVGGPWWFPLALLPTILLRARQLRVGFGEGDILRARRIGIDVHRVTVVTLVVVNLVVR